MARHNEFGKNAELWATEYLKNYNYSILETNWRYSHLEADIIAMDNNVLVFVEVKARQSVNLSFNEIVSQKKQENLLELAEVYIEQKNIDAEIRFDVLIINIYDNKPQFRHIKNAFGSEF